MDTPRLICRISRVCCVALLVDTGEKDGYARLREFGDTEEVCGVDLTIVAMHGFEYV